MLVERKVDLNLLRPSALLELWFPSLSFFGNERENSASDKWEYEHIPIALVRDLLQDVDLGITNKLCDEIKGTPTNVSAVKVRKKSKKRSNKDFV